MGRGSTSNAAGSYMRYLRESDPDDQGVLPADRVLTLLKERPGSTLIEIAESLGVRRILVRETLDAMRRLGLVAVSLQDDEERMEATDDGLRAVDAA
jgi:DNA-binding transcriptional regulator LsrR (DeoR family)